MEKQCPIKTVSANVFQPGMDTITSPLKTALKELEKK
jgi:hypothetical protein